MRKRQRINKKYSPEFKLSVILDMRTNKLGYFETVRKYWDIRHAGDENNYTSRLKLWERIYLEEGESGFMVERRGRGKKAGSNKPLDKKVEEDLIAENQRLRMENEYLKKLRALVLERERESGKKQK